MDGPFVAETGEPGRPAVVFLHGAGASSRMWREHFLALGGRFHCIAPDLPGFGASNRVRFRSRDATADLVADLIEHRVPDKRAHVVGMSWGGALTHSLLARHSGLVDRAVIDSAGILTWRGGPLILMGVAASAPFLHTAPVLRLFGGIIGMDQTGIDDLRASSRRAFLGAFVEGFRSGVAATELRSTSPTLLVAGGEEGPIRRSNAAQAAVMPNAVARFVPGLGHGWLAREIGLHVRMVEAWLTGSELPSELLPEEPATPSDVARIERALEKEAMHANRRLAPRPRGR